jgi:hypothetical protein
VGVVESGEEFAGEEAIDGGDCCVIDGGLEGRNGFVVVASEGAGDWIERGLEGDRGLARSPARSTDGALATRDMRVMFLNSERAVAASGEVGCNSTELTSESAPEREGDSVMEREEFCVGGCLELFG